MVVPPTLKAAKPVGAAMAHVRSLDGHNCHRFNEKRFPCTSNTTDKHSQRLKVTLTLVAFVKLLVKEVALDLFKDASGRHSTCQPALPK